ncbi:MAG TPA: ABC transporter ATP-binding protein [Gammaproteobacteria bacterium]|nr:ABC transporter ATP-binding protein [Gammaproteobacteria bacterium]
MTFAVEINTLRKHYGNVHALQGVDFSIEPGEFFGLLGPNGAGKSTLINIMAGLARASSGTVRIFGHDVVDGYRAARTALGVVPQELVYDAFFTVREVLRLQSGYFGRGRANEAWIDELLEILSLTDKADTNMQALSGGMKRRVLIAQALVHKPEVLVLDEPTAGVDTELRKALWEFTRRLHREGCAIMLTTHYLEEAEALCDRIAILDHGKLAALDSKQKLLSRHPYRLLSLTLADPSKALPEALLPLVKTRDGAQLTLRLHRLEDQIGGILEALRGAGHEIMDLSTQDAGLEEVFMEITSMHAASRTA